MIEGEGVDRWFLRFFFLFFFYFLSKFSSIALETRGWGGQIIGHYPEAFSCFSTLSFLYLPPATASGRLATQPRES